MEHGFELPQYLQKHLQFLLVALPSFVTVVEFLASCDACYILERNHILVYLELVMMR